MSKIETSERSSEGLSAAPRKWTTKDWETQRINASELDEGGVYLLVEDIETKTSLKFGNKPFYNLVGKDERGRKLAIVFSSSKLYQLITDQLDTFVGKRIRLCGSGKGVERQYVVELAD